MITDKYGITQDEMNALVSEVARLESMGYSVPNVIVKHIPHANGIAGLDTIYLNPNTNLDELKYCLRHEVGHHYQPITGIDIWGDLEAQMGDKAIHDAEDYANEWARKTA